MKIICRVDLNAPLPHTLINFLIRKLAGVILYMIQRQTVKVQHDDQCNHAQRIRSNHAFYRDWLLPKLRYLYVAMYFKVCCDVSNRIQLFASLLFAPFALIILVISYLFISTGITVM